MKETISTKWLTDLAFEAEVDGHKIYMDSSREHGGKNTGPRPKPLMMTALAGCTGMEVQYDAFTVDVEGEVSEDHPKRFLNMKVIYRFKGSNINRDKVERAVDLSTTRYCGVSANYSKAFPITYEIQIEEL